jgi:hypothetical protein
MEKFFRLAGKCFEKVEGDFPLLGGVKGCLTARGILRGESSFRQGAQTAKKAKKGRRRNFAP